MQKTKGVVSLLTVVSENLKLSDLLLSVLNCELRKQQTLVITGV